MSNKPDSNPAFPTRHQNGFLKEGMSLRDYACIRLGIPETGKDWLDKIIRKSLRDRFAGQVIEGLCTGCAGYLGSEFSAYAKGSCNAALAKRAVALADAMLAEREKNET